MEAVEKNSSQFEQSFQRKPQLRVPLLGEGERCQSLLLAAAPSCKICVSDMMSSLLFFPPLQMETQPAQARGS